MMSKQLTVSNKLVAYAQDRANAVSAYFDKADHDAVPYSETMTDPRRPIRVGAIIIFLTFGRVRASGPPSPPSTAPRWRPAW